MFAKGNRFPATKPSGVPGPNSYDVRDPEYDAYKHGAFLEEQDRFSKEKPSEVPGPYHTENKGTEPRSVGSRVASGDRYAALQRKLEDLERVHGDSKKMHHAEVERLRQELSRAQRTNAEQANYLTKLKKQKEAYAAQVQELKSNNLASQSEIKELRAKLRVSEHERAQLSSKQDDRDEAKKALQTLNTRHRDELREKDRAIAALEEILRKQQEKVEGVESNLLETRAKADADLLDERRTKKTLELRLHQVQMASEEAQVALQVQQGQLFESEEALLNQLDQHRRMMSRVAEEYGKLASSTVSLTTHDEAKREVTTLRLRVNRLERKLANSESQVVELAHLIRHSNEENEFLLARLREAEQDLAFYADELNAANSYEGTVRHADVEVEDLAQEVRIDFLQSQFHLHQALQSDAALWSTLEGLRSDQLLFHATSLLRHVDSSRHDAETYSKQLDCAQQQNSELLRQVTATRSEQDQLKREHADSSRALAEARAGQESLKQQVEAEKQKTKSETVRLEQTVRREKEARDRAVVDAQKSRAAEEALTNEIHQLHADLVEAERYQQAYNSLIDQVDALIRKNALAEGEAQQLSRFNAEILGHHNPSQRIQYVDRIRRELHETKQELLMMTKERDAVSSENDVVLHELQAYKSVNAAVDPKPRTTLTRVGRANHSLIVKASSTQGMSKSGTGDKRVLETTDEAEYKEGDMTVDELM
ncbi:hypothetical protein PHLGIDRAFT_146852 [Phlebiopsis gigantea 11061_1 CR5-6]|uniref:Hyaluronan-mediated motility receptor C-terminal domain-containing protein n=1 Tax=Phlebiopsis gigantea (strain 11061_1 CR5-6) TaxID=745531 RepID=A0A0C3S8S4_PHLG1|nr:hypothetical protein PHLGIDRAFT_146852 [Phlebiopsis gigantea 11061_1 CR5-6]